MDALLVVIDAASSPVPVPALGDERAPDTRSPVRQFASAITAYPSARSGPSPPGRFV